MNYQLLLLEEPIIINDERAKEGLNYNFALKKMMNLPSDYPEYTTEWHYCRKVIAQDSKGEIDWNGLDEEFGYLSDKKIMDDYLMKTKGSLNYAMRESFVEGVKASPRLTGKHYTLEQMKKYHNIMCLYGNKKGEEYIELIGKPRIFDIEIEMQEANTVVSGGLRPMNKLGGKGLQTHTIYKPKITNGKIKIVRKL